MIRVALLLWAAAALQAAWAQDGMILPPLEATRKFTFATIGDWGRVGDVKSVESPAEGGYDTTGNCYATQAPVPVGGGQYQVALGKAMDAVCKTVGCDAVINTGDNFYECGLDSPMRWKTDYKDVYHSSKTRNIRGLKWYGSFGNHDIMQNLTTQIEYSKKDDTWVIPARYYGYSVNIDLDYTTITAEFSVIFNSPFVSKYSKKSNKYHTPEYVTYSTPAMLSQQLDWLEDRLNKSTANLTFVIGMPDAQGNPSFVRLLNMMRKYQVTAYMNGHAHELDFSMDPVNPIAYQTKYVTTGSGSYPEVIDSCGTTYRPYVLYNNAQTLRGNCVANTGYAAPGFVTMKLDGAGAHLDYYSTYNPVKGAALNGFHFDLPLKTSWSN